MYSLMQPTVLPNGAFDMAWEKRAPVILRAAPQGHPPDVELSAIAMAARENEIQGLRPIALAKAEPAASPAQTAVPAAKAVKRKRAVARAPRREVGPAYASNWWGGGHSQMFGGFGGWYR